MIDAPSSIDESQLKELHKIKHVVFISLKWWENVEYQLFSKEYLITII
jgi:uncharacterized membrane protein YwzB